MVISPFTTRVRATDAHTVGFAFGFRTMPFPDSILPWGIHGVSKTGTDKGIRFVASSCISKIWVVDFPKML